MITGVIFDRVLIAFLTISGFVKLFGLERKQVAELGISYNWVILVGVLQLAAIYFVYTKAYLPVFLLVVIPYLAFCPIFAAKKQIFPIVVLLLISAMIGARWLSLGITA